MKYSTVDITYACSCCEREFDIEYTFGCPARVSGPPEDCYDEEPDEYEPSECPECGAAVDAGRAADLADARVDGLRCDEYEPQEREETW